MNRNRKHLRNSQWDPNLDIDEHAGQTTITKALVYTVYRYSLEPNERLSVDQALRILDKHHLKKQAECMLHFLEDRMVFKKVRYDGNNPFRTWVAYRELVGFRRDLKHKQHFVLLINSEVSHVRYYEVYRTKYKEDMDMVERCIRKAMEDPDGILRLNEQSNTIHATSRTAAESPTQIPRRIQTGTNADTTVYTNTSRRSKSTSPINISSGYKVNAYTSPFMPATRNAVSAAPYSPSTIRNKTKTATYTRVVLPSSAVPRARSTSPIQISYSSNVPNESQPVRNERVALVSSKPPGEQSSSLDYWNGYPKSANRTRTITVFPKSVRSQSPEFTYSPDYNTDLTERQKTAPNVSSTPVQKEPNSLIYSGGYPYDDKRAYTGGPVRYISIPTNSVKQASNSAVYSEVNSPNIHGSEFIIRQPPVGLASAPMNGLPSSLTSLKCYPDRVNEAKTNLHQSEIPTKYQQQSPENGYSIGYPENRFGLQTHEPTQTISIPAMPKPQASPSAVCTKTISSNIYDPENQVESPLKFDEENCITVVNRTEDSVYGDMKSLSNDIVNDIVTAIPASLRSSPDNYPDRFSVHRISHQDNSLSHSNKLLSMSLPAINSASLYSPADLRREAVLSLTDLTYLNYNNTGLVFSEQNGPIYLYAARQPAIGSKQSSSSWDRLNSDQFIANNNFGNQYTHQF